MIRFSLAVSRQLEVVGASSLPSIFFFQQFTHLQSVRSFAIQVEKLSYLVSIESFEFLTPLKISFTYDGPYNCVKSNRKKHTQGLNLNLIKEVP